MSVPGGIRIVATGDRSPQSPDNIQNPWQQQQQQQYQQQHQQQQQQQPRERYIFTESPDSPGAIRVTPVSRAATLNVNHERSRSDPSTQDAGPVRAQRPYNSRSNSDGYTVQQHYATLPQSPLAGPTEVSFNVDGRRASLDSTRSNPPREKVYVIRMSSQEQDSPPTPRAQPLHKFDRVISDNLQRYMDKARAGPMHSSSITHQVRAHKPDDRIVEEDEGTEARGTWHASSNPSSPVVMSPVGSSDRNLFNKFKFQFGSIGNFARQSSNVDSPRETFAFQDFDDMVARIRDLGPSEQDAQGQEATEGQKQGQGHAEGCQCQGWLYCWLFADCFCFL